MSNPDETPTETGSPATASPGRRERGGRGARRSKRQASATPATPYIVRKIPFYDLLDEETLAKIEDRADQILEEIGMEFRGDEEVLRLWREAGADVDGERVRFPRGLPRSIIDANVRPQFTQHARNPARSVEIGGKSLVFVPAYGPPFVSDLENGRRYASLEDFENFVKLAYQSPSLHHSGGTVCEPVDMPVNKRHLDMVYAHMRYSDKPFMGSVTAPERAEDYRRDVPHPVSARSSSKRTASSPTHQHELAAGARCDHERGAARLRGGQPVRDRDAVHHLRRDGPGHVGRLLWRSPTPKLRPGLP